MNTDNLILRETDNLPLINKDDTLTNAEIDGNFINIYNDFISLSQTNDPTLIYDVDRSYSVDEFATYNGRLWIATDVSTGVTPVEGSAEWNDVFPTVLAHEKNKDTILDEGGTNETTVAEIRSFIDAGLTSTTNLSLSTKTGTSFKIESSTGTDVTIPQATNVDAGLLNSEDKVKLDNQSGINTGDQTLESLNAEDVGNKVTDFTTINDVLYPTTQAVDTYLTAQIPSLVETFIDGNVELNTNKAIDFTTINDTLYPSVKAVDDQLYLKVDKVVGSRLITSAESTLLGNTSGTNTGDQIISDATLTTTDITTNNFSTTKHGFVPKGTNTGKYLKDDGTWSTISAGGLTYFTEAQNTSAPNATVNVDSLTAVASTTNADVAIVPKGTGAFTLAVPDNTTVGGNKRGIYAVDLQTKRTLVQSVASGIGSAVLGGSDNKSAGDYSVAIAGVGNSSSGIYSITAGNSNSASNQYSIGLGLSNTSSGSVSVALGYANNASGNGATAIGSSNIVSGLVATAIGNTNTSSGISSIAMGASNSATNDNSIGLGIANTASGYRSVSIGVLNSATGSTSYCFGNGNTANRTNAVAIGYSSTAAGDGAVAIGNSVNTFLQHNRISFSSGAISTAGDIQKSFYMLKGRTTDATPKTLTSDNGGVTTASIMVLQNNNVIRFKGSIVGKQTGTTNVGVWDIDGVIVRGANASATTLTISNINIVTNASLWGTPTLTADTTLGGLTLNAVGLAGTNIQWIASFETSEVIY